MNTGRLAPLKVVGQLAWQLRYDLLAVLIAAVIMARMAGSTLFASVEPAVPLLGVVVSIFIAFRNSSAYNRWWEARTLWGTVVANSQALRNGMVAIDNYTPEMAVVTDRMRRRQVRHVWQLAAELRDVPAAPEIAALTPEDPAGSTSADLLRLQAADARDMRNTDMIDSQGRVILTNLNTAAATAAGGLERIKQQPIPLYYTTFVRFLAWFFAVMVCTRLDGGHAGMTGLVFSVLIMSLFVVAERIGNLAEQPLADNAFGLPMDSFCAAVTADLLGADHPLAR